MNIGDHRLNRFWTISTLLLLIAAVLLAHRVLPDNASELLVQAIQSLHGPGFGTVAVLILFLLGESRQQRQTYLKAAVFTMALAGLSEIAQIPGPRDAQFRDLFVDALGIAGFLSAHALMQTSFRRTMDLRRLIFAGLACVVTLAVTLTPAITLSLSLAQRTLMFPEIMDFESLWERRYSSVLNGNVVVVPAPAGWPVKNSRIGQLHSVGRWGIMLRIYPYPNWHEYSAVSFTAASAVDESVSITFSVRAGSASETFAHHRYLTKLLISPKPTRYVVPFVDLMSHSTGDSINLAHVQALVISESHAKNGVRILVDDFRLEK